MSPLGALLRAFGRILERRLDPVPRERQEPTPGGWPRCIPYLSNRELDKELRKRRLR